MPIELKTNDTLALTLDASQNSTFAGNITFGDSHFIGDDANDNLLIQSSANENIIINSVDDLFLRTGGTTKLTVKNGGNVGIGVASGIDANLRVDANSATLTQEILKVKGGGSGGAYGFLVEANNGDDLFKVNTLSYNSYFTNGNVGIGTDSPVGKFQVSLPAYTNEDTNSQQVIFGGGGGVGVRIGYNETDNKGYINVLKPGVAWGSLILQEEIGKVGIGTTSPNANLHVAGKTLIGASATRSTYGLTVGSSNSSTFSANSDALDGNRTISVVNEASNITNTYATVSFRISPATTTSMGDLKFVRTAPDENSLIWTAKHGANFYDRFTIKSDGRVGIGTTSPEVKLDVEGSLLLNMWSSPQNEQGIFFRRGFTTSNKYNSSILTYDHNGTGNTPEGISINGYDGVSICTGSNTRNERMRITSDGLLFVGDTTTNYGYSSHHIAKNGSQSYALIVRNSNTTTTNNSAIQLNVAATGSNGYFMICRQGDPNTGTSRLLINTNGNVQNVNNSYGAISDERKKENIVDATPKLDKLMDVKVRNFNLIGEETKQIGVVAQELEEVFPGMISESKDPDSEDETLYKSVKYSVFVPMLIKAIQELKADNDSLKARIETLENN